jgi:tripartite-type tricarboxylate transporter receptor subunit TctC
MEAPEMKQTFETQALEPSGVGLEKFRELIRADLAKWKPVVEAVKPAR